MKNLPVSPKLSLGLVLAVLFSSVLANLAAVTPAMLHLGAWAPFVYGTGSAAIAFLAGYFKSDPLMTAGAAASLSTAAPAPEMENTPAVVPAVPTAALPVTPPTA